MKALKIKTLIFVLLSLLTKTAFSQEVFRLNSNWNNMPLNDISIPGTHNSFSNHADIPFQIPGTLNAKLSLAEQLSRGIRAIELDVHEALISNRLVVGHIPTEHMFNASKPFAYFLKIVNDFLLTHTNQFLVLKLQSFVPEGRINTELQKYPALLKLLFIHTQNKPIPNLKQLIKNNQRLIIVLGDKKYGSNLTQISTRNGLSNREDIYTAKNYSKGPSDADLFDTANYNTSELGGSSPSDARYNNESDRLEEFCVMAWASTGKKPFRITVDYPSEGDVFKVANNLNNNYYSVKGSVQTKTGETLPSVTWNIHTGTSKKSILLQNKITAGSFSFPLNKQYGHLNLTPISDTFRFSPETVMIDLNNYSKNNPLKFIATPK